MWCTSGFRICLPRSEVYPVGRNDRTGVRTYRNEIIFISALKNQNIDLLKKKLLKLVNAKTIKTANTVVTNVRHYDSLVQTRDALNKVLDSIETGKTGDIIALDIRNGLHYLGEITGEITTEDLLRNIFSKFCIGK